MRVICLFGVFLCGIAVGCSKGSTPTTPERADADRAKSLEEYDFPIGSTDIERGQEVYGEFCEGCHPGGGAGDGPKIAGIAESASQMRFEVRHGHDDVEGFDSSKISDDDLEALVAFTVALGAVDPSL